MRWAALCVTVTCLAFAARAADGPEVFEKLKPSMVKVYGPYGHGSGFVIDNDGRVVTNFHVVTTPGPIRIQYGRLGNDENVVIHDVTVVGYHPDYDLALLQPNLKERGAPHPAKLAGSMPKKDDASYAIGSPGSALGTVDNAITEGAIVDPEADYRGLPYLETTAAINPGNSGGPLVSSTGEVFGVNTFSLLEEANSRNFAVPVVGLKTADFVGLADRRQSDEQAAHYRQRAEAAIASRNFAAALQNFSLARLYASGATWPLLGILRSCAGLPHRPGIANVAHATAKLCREFDPLTAGEVCYQLAQVYRRRHYLPEGLAWLRRGAQAGDTKSIAELNKLMPEAVVRAIQGLEPKAPPTVPNDVPTDRQAKLDQLDLRFEAPEWGKWAGAKLQRAKLDAKRTAALRGVPLLIGQHAEIPLADVRSLAVMPDGRLYVAIGGSDRLQVLNARTMAKIADLPMPANPIHLEQMGHLLLVASDAANLVSIYDTRRHIVTGSIPIMGAPWTIGADPERNTIVIAYAWTRTLHVDLKRKSVEDLGVPLERNSPGLFEGVLPTRTPAGEPSVLMLSYRKDQRWQPVRLLPGSEGTIAPDSGNHTSIVRSPQRGGRPPGELLIMPQLSNLMIGIMHDRKLQDTEIPPLLSVTDLKSEAIKRFITIPAGKEISRRPEDWRRTVFSPELMILYQVRGDAIHAYRVGP